MIHNTTRNSAYNDSFVCEKTHSQLKDWGATKTAKTGDDASFFLVFFIHQIGENNNSNRNSFNPLLYRCFRVLRVDGFHGFRYNLMVYYKEE